MWKRFLNNENPRNGRVRGQLEPPLDTLLHRVIHKRIQEGDWETSHEISAGWMSVMTRGCSCLLGTVWVWLGGSFFFPF